MLRTALELVCRGFAHPRAEATDRFLRQFLDEFETVLLPPRVVPDEPAPEFRRVSDAVSVLLQEPRGIEEVAGLLYFMDRA